jgi:hypothetical protein
MLEMGGKNGQKCVPDHICISLLTCPFCHLIAANLQNPGNNPPSRRENFPLTYMKKQGDYWINKMLHQQLTFSKCRPGTDWRGCPATTKNFGV